MTIIDEIRRRADEQSHHVALLSARRDGADVPTTYADLVRQLERYSRLVSARIDGPARLVGLVAPQGSEFVAAALGVLDAGCCLVPIPDDQSDAALRAFARHSGLHALLRPADPPSLEIIDGAPPPRAELVALDPSYIRFTSGTTSERKGVVISHRRLLERLSAANRGMAIERGDRVMWLLPMAHHFVVSILLYLRHGATILLPATSLAQSVLELAGRAGATVFYASPYHYGLLAADASSQRLDTVRLAVSTAEGLREETARRFRDRFDRDLAQALGIIEVGLPVMNRAAAATKPTALGRPLPDYDVWLRSDDGAPVTERGAEHCGEICIRGPGMFDAYLDPWVPSRELLEPDGFRTGDQGWFDADGDLHLVGRRTNRINMAGMKFFAEEVEAVLDAHPAVLRSRVAAREHPHLGQIPVAEIVAAPGSEPPTPRQLTEFCKQCLPAYKIPRQFHFVDALPMTPTGKVRRGGDG